MMKKEVGETKIDLPDKALDLNEGPQGVMAF